MQLNPIGVTGDSYLIFVPHVNNICRALSRSFHSIRRLRKYHTQADTERIVYAFVGIPSREIEKLQRLQNTAAMLTVCMKKTDHITPVLKKLHSVDSFKRALETYLFCESSFF